MSNRCPTAPGAELVDTIVQRAIAGDSPRIIARDLCVPVDRVRTEINKHARRIRDQSSDRVARRFLRQDELLTRLIDKWASMLEQGFDRDVAGALLKAMERQARLLGLETKSLDTDKWLAEASDAALIAELESTYGIKVSPDLLNPSRN